MSCMVSNIPSAMYIQIDGKECIHIDKIYKKSINGETSKTSSNSFENHFAKRGKVFEINFIEE